MGFFDIFTAAWNAVRSGRSMASAVGDGSFVPDEHPANELERAPEDRQSVPEAEIDRAVSREVGPPAGYVDRRKFASAKHVYGKRDWSRVTGICLHQTACVLGERDARWDGIGCHVGVTRGGKVEHLHDFDKLVVHGNGWNTQTVGIEIDGEYEGILGNPRTFWRPKDEPNRQPTPLTAETIAATKQLIRWICAEVERHGGKVKVLVAHRQSSGQRDSDPGSAIWKEIALPMMEELGLSDGGPGFKIGTGSPIPEAWDPRKKGIKY